MLKRTRTWLSVCLVMGCLSCFGLVSCSDDDEGFSAEAVCEHKVSCFELEEGRVEEEYNSCVADAKAGAEGSKLIGCLSEYSAAQRCIGSAPCSSFEHTDEEDYENHICFKELDAYMHCVKSNMPDDAWAE